MITSIARCIAVSRYVLLCHLQNEEFLVFSYLCFFRTDFLGRNLHLADLFLLNLCIKNNFSLFIDILGNNFV